MPDEVVSFCDDCYIRVTPLPVTTLTDAEVPADSNRVAWKLLRTVDEFSTTIGIRFVGVGGQANTVLAFELPLSVTPENLPALASAGFFVNFAPAKNSTLFLLESRKKVPSVYGRREDRPCQCADNQDDGGRSNEPDDAWSIQGPTRTVNREYGR